MEKIIGHELVTKELEQVIKSNKIGHAYIFEGVDGIGKFLVAKEFARAIMCEKKTGKACMECEACHTFESGTDVAVLEEQEGIIKVDRVREFIKGVYLKPNISDRKVFIIRDADKLKENCQDVLLKTLEEPPQYITIILTVSNKIKLPSTIISRCTIIRFQKLTKDELKQIRSIENLSEDILKYADGSVSKLDELLKKDYITYAKQIKELIDVGDIIQYNKVMTELKQKKNFKENIIEILNNLEFMYYEEFKSGNMQKVEIIDNIRITKESIERSANFDIALDAMMIRLCEKVGWLI